MVVIGVTGGLGTGKSTVSRMLGELGAKVIDADRVAHTVMEPKRLAWRRIVQTFGEGYLNEDQTIHRQQLAARVFRDPEARRQLEAIVHPQVIRHIKQHLRRLTKDRQIRVVVLDVPLLVETHQQGLVDALVVVTAPVEVARARLAQRGWSDEEIAQRMRAQENPSAKAAVADCVVDNSDWLEQTRRQVRHLWNRLQAVKRRRRG